MFSQVPFALFAGLNSHDRIQQKKGKKSKKCSNQTENRIKFFFFLKDQSQFHGKEENPCGRVMRETKFPLHKEIKPHPFTSEPRAHRYSAENGEIKEWWGSLHLRKGKPRHGPFKITPKLFIDFINYRSNLTKLRFDSTVQPWAAPQGEG